MTDQELIEFLLKGPSLRAEMGLICAEDFPQIEAANRLSYLSVKYEVFERLIKALPRCNKCFEKPATRHETFEDYNSFNEKHYTEHVWRCDDCGSQIIELDYAKELREYLNETLKTKNI